MKKILFLFILILSSCSIKKEMTTLVFDNQLLGIESAGNQEPDTLLVLDTLNSILNVVSEIKSQNVESDKNFNKSESF